jgi:uncharacterized protein
VVNFSSGQYYGPNLISKLLRHEDKEALSGNGLVALVDIPAYTLLVVFSGHAATLEEYRQWETFERDLALQVDKDHYIGPKFFHEVDPGDYVNHSCEPNCGILGPNNLVSMRKISQGEEVHFDYAMSESGGLPDMQCECNTSSCRKLIKANDWERPELQKSYGWFFSPYLLKEIKHDPTLEFNDKLIDLEKHLFAHEPFWDISRFYRK